MSNKSIVIDKLRGEIKVTTKQFDSTTGKVADPKVDTFLIDTIRGNKEDLTQKLAEYEEMIEAYDNTPDPEPEPEEDEDELEIKK